jgi:glycolate oxidase FAD binding subunit
MSPVAATDYVQDLIDLVGPAAIRTADAGDAIDNVQPGLVIEPDSAAGLAAVLAWASARRVPVVLRGGGTHLGWGRVPAVFDLVVSTRRLCRIRHHEPGDLTVSVEAGMTLSALNRALGLHGQTLPLDAPSDASTIGGLIAVNDGGPLRHRHGLPRDLLIGIHLATTDGRLVKAGGNVVKNVAGYDLGRLMCGSFGSLAAIVSATFKLAPVPADVASLVAEFGGADALAGASAAIAAGQLDPLSVDVHAQANTSATPPGTGGRLLIRCAGLAGVNDAQIAEARRVMTAFQPDRLEVASGEADADLWHDQSRGPWASTGTLVRVSWLPAALAAVVALIDEVARTRTLTVTLTGRAALGTGLMRLEGDVGAQAAAVDLLRARPDVVSHVVLARADAAVKALVDVWGPPAETASLLRRIKDTMDPAGVLNAFRGMI